MSTNYYLEKTCDCCNHADRIHLGKTAAGWMFLGRKQEGVTDFNGFARVVAEKWLDGYVLVDGYGRERSPVVFLYDIMQLKDMPCHVCAYPSPHDTQCCDHEHGIGFYDHEFS